MEKAILIYDDLCPLCSWYSMQFVRFGFLTKEGRIPFSSVPAEHLSKIDFNRSRNEIPLLDTRSGKVLYGIDALLEILDRKIPCIKKTGNLPGIKWFLKKLYKLISYNRKVIVAKKCGNGQIDCAPDLNMKYRFLFMFLCFVLNTLMIYPVHEYVLSGLSYFQMEAGELQKAHLSLVMVNILLFFLFKKEKGTEFLGQVNMLATMVILLLTPLVFTAKYLTESIITVYIVVLTAVIIHEYLRRMEYAGLLSGNKWIITVNFLSMTGFLLYLFNHM